MLRLGDMLERFRFIFGGLCKARLGDGFGDIGQPDVGRVFCGHKSNRGIGSPDYDIVMDKMVKNFLPELRRNVQLAEYHLG